MATAAIPAPTAPLVDQATGFPTPAWWFFFQAILARTGGTSGTGTTVSPPVVVTVGPSPATFAAPKAGTLVVSGGGVCAMTISRSGSTFDVGSFYAAHPMKSGDILTTTYVSAPTMTWFPG